MLGIILLLLLLFFFFLLLFQRLLLSLLDLLLELHLLLVLNQSLQQCLPGLLLLLDSHEHLLLLLPPLPPRVLLVHQRGTRHIVDIEHFFFLRWLVVGRGENLIFRDEGGVDLTLVVWLLHGALFQGPLLVTQLGVLSDLGGNDPVLDSLGELLLVLYQLKLIRLVH